MGTAIVKAACNCALLMVNKAIGTAVGPPQFAVETKGGCALLQWAGLTYGHGSEANSGWSQP